LLRLLSLKFTKNMKEPLWLCGSMSGMPALRTTWSSVSNVLSAFNTDLED